MDYGELVQDGGIFSRRRALALGVPIDELNRMLRTGTLERLRSGWYAIAGRDSLVERAVKAGGVLSCVSALGRYTGVWIPPGDGLHVRRSGYFRRSVSTKPVVAGRDSGRVTSGEPAGKGSGRAASRPTADPLGSAAARRGCCAYRSLPAPTRAVDSLLVALACAARCVSDEYLVAILDSVLHHRLATLEQLVETFADAPPRIVALLGELDEKAGSGTESLVRFRLRRLGVTVRTQQYFEGVGRVDLLVGDRMIVECDSKSHHLGKQYYTDRSRDLISVSEGRITVRLTYESVLFDWATVEPILLKLIRRRAHLFRVKNRQPDAATRRDDGLQIA